MQDSAPCGKAPHFGVGATPVPTRSEAPIIKLRGSHWTFARRSPRSRALTRATYALDSSEKMAELGLLSAQADAAANSGAEIPSGRGEIADVDATVAIENVAKIISAEEKVPVNLGVLCLAGRMELPGIVNDSGQAWRGNTCATDDEESAGLACIQVGVHQPDSGVGVGIEGK